ncbi:MAG: sugar phosphate isomerase/epimerase family protein [Elusimicrobiota bacterium]
MKIGRNFTNTFIVDKLSEKQREKVLSGDLDLASMNALGLREFKADVDFQLNKIKELGFNWLELDCDVPNPYLDFTDEQAAKIKKKAEDMGISLSIHLSYSSFGKEVSCLQDYERGLVIKSHKKYLDFGEKIGAKACVLHPGSAPFYHLTELFLEQYEEAVLDSVVSLANYAQKKGIKFHVENNVSFDNLYYETEDLLRIVKKARDRGAKVWFNFDIGHWFTRAEKPEKEIPEDFLSELDKIPPEYVYELHLNDYVPKKVIFHPPLMDTPGQLKEEKLKEYFRILKEKLKPEVVILETALKTKEQLADREELIRDESEYVKNIAEQI